MKNEVEQLRARLQRIEALNEASRRVHSTLELKDSLQIVLDEAIHFTRATSGTVCLINPTTGFLEIEVARGLPEAVWNLRLKVGEGLTGHVAYTGKAVRSRVL